MKIQEYLAKGILSNYGIIIPASRFFSQTCEVEPPFLPCVLKSQVLTGSRMKNGGILFAENQMDFNSKIKELIWKPINEVIPEGVLVEEKLNIDREYYCCLFINRKERDIFVSISEEGGIDIEAHADSLTTLKYDEMLDYLSSSGLYEIRDIVQKMKNIMEKEDATYIEINPLALTTEKKFVALDCVMDLDENATFRHDHFKSLMPQSDFQEPFHYVPLNGDIGIIGCGAGIVMATMDTVQMKGGKPANFLDIGGGAQKAVTYDALTKLYTDGIRRIVLNIFGGITSCNEIADAVIAFKTSHKDSKLYIRIDGNDAKLAREKLFHSGIMSYEHMYEMIDACMKGVAVEC